MDEDIHPMIPPLSGPITDKLVGFANANPIVIFTIVAVALFAAIAFIMEKN